MATVLEEQATEIQTMPQACEPVARRFTVEEYYRMGEAGIFDDGGQVELFEGRIYKLSPKNPLHSATVGTAGECLAKSIGRKCIVRTQEPVRFDDYSEPEPDVVLVKRRKDRYSLSHPTPADCLLVLEVSLTTLGHDRKNKGQAYAAAGIAQYLILNLNAREMEDYREPDADGYRSKKIYRADERFNLVAFPEVEITVGDLLPPEA